MTPLLTVEVRPATPSDEPALRRIFRSTRADDLAAIGWPEQQIGAFCDQQYDIRCGAYALAYPDADHGVVVGPDGESIGELIVDADGSTTTIVNIALLPSHRARGIGSTLIRQLAEQADRAGRVMDLTVDLTNPARRLYERFGFRIIESDELHHQMRRDASRKDHE